MIFNYRPKAVSALIATILLVVVSVALTVIILTWGKGFTNSNLSSANSLLDAPASDAQFYLTIENGVNGRFLAKYNPPLSYNQRSIRITSFRLFDYNNIVPLKTPVDINAGDTKALDLGIVNSPFDLVLYLDNNTTITKRDIKTINLCPSSIDCPTGFIPVPGNHLYNTVQGKGGFCVAKYEMKVDENNDGAGDTNLDCKNPGNNVWKNSTESCGYNLGNRVLVSSPEGYPLTNISFTTAIAACESIGGHLITNNEWVTLARNIEMVPSNWSGGIVGVGKIKGGNTGMVDINNSYNGSDPDYGTNRNSLSSLTLTNGEIIWDLSGNVWEWTNNIIQIKDQPDGIYDVNGVACVGFGWFDYSIGGGVEAHIINDGNVSVLGYNQLKLLSSGEYNANNGVGRIFTYSGGISTSSYAFYRGGSWSNIFNAGILNLAMNLNAGDAANSIGLRCVIVS